jgi:hypothetical protein
MKLVNENEKMVRTNNKQVGIGLVLIALAGLLFADNFDILPWGWEHYVFTWQSLLIVIGLISLAKNESRTTGIILISVGGFFLAAKFLEFSYTIHHLLWPTLLTIVGILMIVRHKNQHLFSGKEK